MLVAARWHEVGVPESLMGKSKRKWDSILHSWSSELMCDLCGCFSYARRRVPGLMRSEWRSTVGDCMILHDGWRNLWLLLAGGFGTKNQLLLSLSCYFWLVVMDICMECERLVVFLLEYRLASFAYQVKQYWTIIGRNRVELDLVNQRLSCLHSDVQLAGKFLCVTSIQPYWSTIFCSGVEEINCNYDLSYAGNMLIKGGQMEENSESSYDFLRSGGVATQSPLICRKA